MGRRRVARYCLIPLLAFSLGGGGAWSQESSVRPGVNDRFLDPEVATETFVAMFENDSREIYASRHEIVETLQLTEGTEVADIGAGTGFFSRMMAEHVGDSGTVYAVDISKNLLEHIDRVSEELSISNIETVVGGERSVGLDENSVDAVFICDTYHHFEYPFDIMASIHAALRPGGKLVIVDFERVIGVSSDFAVNHVRSGKGTVTDEVKDSGFALVKEVPIMREQYVLVFEKRDLGR